MIQTSKINHWGENRLKLVFAYNDFIINKIKHIDGAAWSKTLGAGHIPFTSEDLGEFKKLFLDVVAPHSAGSKTMSGTEELTKATNEPPVPTPSPAMTDPEGKNCSKSRSENVAQYNEIDI
jgi:hypothetical protein